MAIARSRHDPIPDAIAVTDRNRPKSAFLPFFRYTTRLLTSVNFTPWFPFVIPVGAGLCIGCMLPFHHLARQFWLCFCRKINQMTAGLERPAELGGGSLGQDSRGIGLVEPGGRRPFVPLRGGKGMVWLRIVCQWSCFCCLPSRRRI